MKWSCVWFSQGSIVVNGKAAMAVKNSTAQKICRYTLKGSITRWRMVCRLCILETSETRLRLVLHDWERPGVTHVNIHTHARIHKQTHSPYPTHLLSTIHAHSAHPYTHPHPYVNTLALLSERWIVVHRQYDEFVILSGSEKTPGAELLSYLCFGEILHLHLTEILERWNTLIVRMDVYFVVCTVT